MEAAEEPRPPKVSVGPDFEILERVAEGGMATVYRAREISLDRIVAVKVIDARRVARTTVERFQREARLASRLQHPHVVSIYGHGTTTSGSMWISMEWLQGRTLANVLRAEGALSSFRAIKLGRQVLSGLACAHQAGVLHRDLKPSNVFLTRPAGHRDEHVTLLDFGLALHAGNREPLTASNHVVGTVGYMSPEQSAGRPTDARSDLYAVGVLLHEMIFGRPLPMKSSPDGAGRSGLAPAGLPQVPGALLDLIDRLVAFRPDERPASVHQVLEMLDRIELAPPATGTIGSTVAYVSDARTPTRLVRGLALSTAVAAGLAMGGWALLGGKVDGPSSAVLSSARPDAAVSTPPGRAVATSVDAASVAPSARSALPGLSAPSRPAGVPPADRRKSPGPRPKRRVAAKSCPDGIRVESVPTAAFVFVDGQQVGRTPLVRPAPLRPTALRIEAAGFEAKRVRLQNERPCRMRVRLEIRDPTAPTTRGTDE